MDRRPTGAPRWPVLLGLCLGVLGAHLWLLTGGSSWTAPGDTPAPVAPVAPGARTDAAAEPVIGAGAAAALTVFPVPVSQVRWIAPPSPVATESAPTTRRAPAPRTAEPRDMPPPPPRQSKPAEPAVSAPAPAESAAPTPDTAPALPGEPASAEPAPAVTMAATPASEPVAEAPAMALPEPPAPETTAAPARAAAPTTPTPRTGDSPLPATKVAGNAQLLYDIEGQAKGLRYSADARLQWQVDGAAYRATLEISAFLMGSRVQTSEGRIGPQGLQPQRFGDKRRRTEKAAHFDAAGQRIRFSNNAPDAPLLPLAQDRLSVFLQLGALLQANPAAHPPGSRIELQVAGTGGADVWSFEVGDSEVLSLPAGELGAVRLLRTPRHEHDSRVEIWLAPELQHLPVRIRLTEADGSLADQRLSQMPQR